jgi:hypothetical protein
MSNMNRVQLALIRRVRVPARGWIAFGRTRKAAILAIMPWAKRLMLRVQPQLLNPQWRSAPLPRLHRRKVESLNLPSVCPP